MKTLLSILIVGLTAAGTFAESSESDAQFFHPAASFYIQGDTTSASNLVVQGLAIYPEDGKLKRLKELLEKQQEQDSKNENENQQENQEQPQDPEKQEDQENQEEEPQEPDQPETEPGEQEPQEQQPAEPESAEQMSEDEAKQLLDAMRQEEKNKRLQLHPVMGAPVKVDKDW